MEIQKRDINWVFIQTNVLKYHIQKEVILHLYIWGKEDNVNLVLLQEY